MPLEQYRGTDQIGKIGIEKYYESHLLGTAGYEEIETNAQSRALRTVSTVEPVAGSNIYLTLDIDLQKIAYDALHEYNGAAVAIEIKTGGVLVFASRPGFDPNPFVSGISAKDYKALKDSEDQPLYNRALRGLYPPGSTMKPFYALAGLEYGVIDYGHRLFCPGYYKLPNVDHKYRDWKKWGHGMVDMNEAITESCDVYFYDLAMALGIDKMSGFMHKFGFGEKSGIDLVGEVDGLMPSKEWKRRYRNQVWFPGETVITGIGQGYTQVTPLQLARATATLANYGKVVNPHLVQEIITPDYAAPPELRIVPDIPLKPANVDNILRSMTNVVHSPRGTAKLIAKNINYQIAGKTGTAQVFTVKQEEKYNEDAVDFKMRDHALFIALAPVHDPQIAVAVIAEHGATAVPWPRLSPPKSSTLTLTKPRTLRHETRNAQRTISNAVAAWQPAAQIAYRYSAIHRFVDDFGTEFRDLVQRRRPGSGNAGTPCQPCRVGDRLDDGIGAHQSAPVSDFFRRFVFGVRVVADRRCSNRSDQHGCPALAGFGFF